ncbi:MAG: tetratricopeptide repeat protein [Polyangiaceae bacterium]
MAREPTLRGAWALHVRVDRLLHPPSGDDSPPIEAHRDEELRLEAARSMLEQAHAESSPDVRLRFDLGIVYEELATVTRRVDLHEKVIALLGPALERASNHPAATEALEALVYAYAKLDRPQDELRTWKIYIPRLVDARARVAPMMNMGEAEMRLGRLEEAVETFRDTIRLCETIPSSSTSNSTYALTLWDLALALDRSGDATTALQMAAKAKGWTWSEVIGWGPAQALRTVTGWDVIRDDESVFFVPEWDRDWYLALGFVASARAVDDPRDAADLWAQAEAHWDTYIRRATSAGGPNPWLALARRRHDRTHAARLDAEKQAAKWPPRVPPKGETRVD